jgi:hypothetical protein
MTVERNWDDRRDDGGSAQEIPAFAGMTVDRN